MILPRYSCIFIRRYCPRNCGYCIAKDVRGEDKGLTPDQWIDALRILEDNGIVFHLILGNELLAYPHVVEFVEKLNEFRERYAVYSTFPQPWTDKWLDLVIDAGLWNISGGIDVVGTLKTGDIDVDDKSESVLKWLIYCKARGVPDIHATVTMHRHNYDKLESILDLCTEEGIWVALNMIEYSLDGKHDFYKDKEGMVDWLIPDSEKGKFRDTMYHLAEQIRTERWMIQVPPRYFEEVGDREYNNNPWHCSEPLIIHLEEDGFLRACSYRGPLKERHSVFELGDGRLTMEQYANMQLESTSECPGCGGGGGAWSYWWQAEEWLKGDQSVGDKVFQIHTPGYEFEKTIKKK